MKRLYFGTDGVRGPYGGPVINETFAARLGEAAGRWIGGRGRVLIGRDTRASGESLVAAVAAGLAAAGLEPVSLGVLPTPAVARAVRAEGAVLGVVVTASHNPAADNGIKFFAGTGIKLTDADEARIEALLPDAPAGGPARVELVRHSGAAQAYVDAARALLPSKSLAGWRIVLDTANGATAVTSAMVLRALGAEITGIGDAPDGFNINAGVGSEHPEKLAEKVRATGARLGIAHDGDGDRCILCDEHGEVLDGDEVLTLLALHALKQDRLAAKTLVVTVQSNLGVDAAVTAAGGRVARTAVGDRYVIERMLADGAVLGGESSGHIICADVSPTGDGLVAALKVLEVMLATGHPLSALRGALRKFPQATCNLKVRAKRELSACTALTAAIAALEAELGAQGRVLVRFSGTEAKLRLLVEGPTDQAVQSGIGRLETAARSDLEVV
ncbi:MAG: phosphoglucosamine mutase [Verrucomicrobia bacterium]|nr:phosphoglucosamine mutase [Verrucomicrobiota bacterium]